MQVRKRNGNLEDVSFDKVLRRIKYLADGKIAGEDGQYMDNGEQKQTTYALTTLDPVTVAQKVCSQIYDGVSTSELDEFAARICISLQTENLEYGVLSSRLIISNNHKNTKNSFSECVAQLDDVNVLDKKMVEFVQKNSDALNSAIVHKRDYNSDYIAFKTLEKSYLLRVNKKTVERVQYMFMRVSCGIHYPDLKEVLKSYEGMSDKFFTHATPTLFNAGTSRPQLFSCFLTAPEDSIVGIYKWISDLARISKEAGGIGGTISCIRGKGSVIRGTNSYSRGVVPMLQVVNETMKYVNQGGRRAGSAAMYIQPHHPDIIGFLEIRLNHGNEDDRCRELFSGLFIPDLFMQRVEEDEAWSLFDPNQCPGLNEAVGDDYKTLYEKYEKSKKATRVLRARDIWKAFVKSQIETGAPYTLFKDHCNRKSNQKNYGTITGSNLCAEILEYHDHKEYACCSLASICLPRFLDVESKTYDFVKLAEIAGQITRNLNRVIDLNMYPVPETKVSNMRHRPIGIGVQGLADVFCMMRFPFDSLEAADLNKEIFAAIYYGAMKASMELAKKDGPYETFWESPLAQGQFQFDLWNVTPSAKWDWDTLRKDVMKYGARNSLLTACMPTASTSQILGWNETMEPYTSNLYVRRTLSGDFVIANKHMIRDLESRGLWCTALKDEIIAHNGSIQHIDGIPADIKALYKTSWELSQKTLLNLSIDRGPYICQTQSLNLFFEEPTYSKLSSSHFYSWKKGLKTGSYYIRSRPKLQAQQFTLDPSMVKKSKPSKVLKKQPTKVVCTDEVCYSCSG